MRHAFILILALLGACSSHSASAPAAPTSPNPALASPFFHNYSTTKPSEFAGRRPGPIGWPSPAELATSSPPDEARYVPIFDRIKLHNLLPPDGRIADVGAGRGTLSLMLARDAPAGTHVFAIELQPALVGYIAGRASERGIDNLTPVLSSATSLQLPWPFCGPPDLPGRLDLIVILDSYHEFADPAAMLKSIRNCIKPRTEANSGGRVAVIEMRAETKDRPAGPLHTMRREQIISEWASEGFALIDSDDTLPRYHFLVFAAAAR